MAEKKIQIECPLAPPAIGPYSQALKVGGMMYVSGQLPLDPKTGRLTDPDIAGQTRRALENLKAILEFAGAGTGMVVKTTVYLTSLLDFELMNEVYAEYFPFEPPARSTVEVAALPKGALIEIDAISLVPVLDTGAGPSRFGGAAGGGTSAGGLGGLE